MTDHPLGNTDPDTTDTAASNGAPTLDEPSIVDTILDLDEFLSGDVRRAERTARFATEPQLEADIDRLESQLEGLTDDRGRPLGDTSDKALGDEGAGPAGEIAREVKRLQAEYAASFRSVRVRQMPADDWTAFQHKHRKALEAGAPFPDALWDELIVACAIAPTFTVEQVRKLRRQLGHPQVHLIAMAAWHVNTSSGVSIPKSSISSAVLRHMERDKS